MSFVSVQASALHLAFVDAEQKRVALLAYSIHMENWPSGECTIARWGSYQWLPGDFEILASWI
jgi:hypothetical protein